MKVSKRCKPLKCKTFTRKAQQFEEKTPVAVFVVKCPYRAKDLCGNEKEALTEVFY